MTTAIPPPPLFPSNRKRKKDTFVTYGGTDQYQTSGSAYAQDSYYGSDDNGNRYGDWDAGSPNEVEAGGLSMFAGVDLWTVISDRTTHGILAACSFAVLFPAGAILVRLPWRHAWIFHALAQGIACILYIAAAAIGIRLIDVVRIPPSGTSLVSLLLFFHVPVPCS